MTTANNNNNNNRVSSAVSAGNVSKIQNTKVTGKFNELSTFFFDQSISWEKRLFITNPYKTNI